MADISAGPISVSIMIYFCSRNLLKMPCQVAKAALETSISKADRNDSIQHPAVSILFPLSIPLKILAALKTLHASVKMRTSIIQVKKLKSA